MDAQCWYQGAAALMRHTLPTGCLDGRNTAMLRTLTAYYENAHPQSGPPTHVQCYQAMQAWCRAGRKKKADMPDKGTVMMPRPKEFLFHNWAPHYEADPALEGEYAAAPTGVAEVRVTVLERGHHYVIAATATSPGPQWLVKGTDTMLAPGTAPPGAVGDPTTQHRVLRGVLKPGEKPPARALAHITSGKAGYHLGLAMLCLTHWIQRRWPPTGTVPWI